MRAKWKGTPSARKARNVLNENSRSSCENQSQQQVHFFKRYKSAKKLSKTFWNFIEHFIVFHWKVNTESASLLRQRLRCASIAAEAKYTFKLLSFISLSSAITTCFVSTTINGLLLNILEYSIDKRLTF